MPYANRTTYEILDDAIRVVAMIFGIEEINLIIYLMGRKGIFMYIPEFWCGFITGTLAIIAGIFILLVWFSRRGNEKEDKKKD